MKLNWHKMDETIGGLIPAIIQDARTREVLMLGYMNQEAMSCTQSSGEVTFFSRSRQSLWRKGETSGNRLEVIEILPDCDGDALLVLVRPTGPVCHRNTPTCFDVFGQDEKGGFQFFSKLQDLIQKRFEERPKGSYVSRLCEEGLDRIAQKVGEEAVETVIAAKNSDATQLDEEAADLTFHLMLLLQFRGSSLGRVLKVLEKRHLTSS